MELLTLLDPLQHDTAIIQESLSQLNHILTLGHIELRVQAFVSPLLQLISKMKNSHEQVLLALTNINLILDIEPRCSTIFMQESGADIICSLLLDINDFEVASQSLKCLSLLTTSRHKETESHLCTLILAGGLNACVAFYDFFPVPMRKLALTVLSNMSTCIHVKSRSKNSLDIAGCVLVLLPNLHSLLQSVTDPELLPLLCVSFARILFAYESSFKTERELPRNLFFNDWTDAKQSGTEAPHKLDKFNGWQFAVLQAAAPATLASSLIDILVERDLDKPIISNVVRCLSIVIKINSICIPDIMPRLLIILHSRLEKEIGENNVILGKEDEIADTIDLIASAVPKIPSADIYSWTSILDQQTNTRKRKFTKIASSCSLDSQIPVSKVDDIWACEMCTFHNPVDVAACSMCGQVSRIIKDRVENVKNGEKPCLKSLLSIQNKKTFQTTADVLLGTDMLDQLGEIVFQDLLWVSANSCDDELRVLCFELLTSFSFSMSISSLSTQLQQSNSLESVAVALCHNNQGRVVALKMVYVLLLRLPGVILPGVSREGIYDKIINLSSASGFVGDLSRLCQGQVSAYPCIENQLLVNVVQQLRTLADSQKVNGRSLRKRRSVSQPAKSKKVPLKKRKCSSNDVELMDDEISQWISPLTELKTILLNGITLFELQKSGLLEALNCCLQDRSGIATLKSVFYSPTSNAQNVLENKFLTWLHSIEEFEYYTKSEILDALGSIAIKPTIDFKSQIVSVLSNISQVHGSNPSLVSDDVLMTLNQNLRVGPLLSVSDVSAGALRHMKRVLANCVMTIEKSIFELRPPEIHVGALVEPAIDWKWKIIDQVGIVVKVTLPWVLVKWNNNQVNAYRYGHNHFFDVQMKYSDSNIRKGVAVSIWEDSSWYQGVVRKILCGEFACVEFLYNEATCLKWVSIKSTFFVVGKPSEDPVGIPEFKTEQAGLGVVVDVMSHDKCFRGIIMDRNPENKYLVGSIDEDFSENNCWYSQAAISPFLSQSSERFSPGVLRPDPISNILRHLSPGNEDPCHVGDLVYIVYHTPDESFAIQGEVVTVGSNVDGKSLILRFDMMYVDGISMSFVHASIPTDSFTIIDLHSHLRSMQFSNTAEIPTKLKRTATTYRASRSLDHMRITGGPVSDPTFVPRKNTDWTLRLVTNTHDVLSPQQMLLEALRKSCPAKDTWPRAELEFDMVSRKDHSLGSIVYPVGELISLSGSFKVNTERIVTVNSHFASVSFCGGWLRSGSWYLELEVVSSGLAQIGFASLFFSPSDASGVGCGDDCHSWAFDGSRQRAWSVHAKEWGKAWTRGDIIGCAISIDASTRNASISYSLNGTWELPMGLAFDKIRFAGPVIRPVITFNSSFQFRTLLHPKNQSINPAVRYDPPTDAYQTIGVLLDKCKEDFNRQLLPVPIPKPGPIIGCKSKEIPVDVLAILDLLKHLSQIRMEAELQPIQSFRIAQKFLKCVRDPLTVCSNSIPSWAWSISRNYSFLLPLEGRVALFKYSSFGVPRAVQNFGTQSLPLRNKLRDGDVFITNGLSRGTPPRRQKAVVPRDRVLDAAMFLMGHVLSKKLIISVEFRGEIGHGIGPTLEFYSLVCSEVQRKSLELWASLPDLTTEFVFNPAGLWPLPVQLLEMVGVEPQTNVPLTNEVVLDQHAGISNLPRGRRTLKCFRFIGKLIGKALQDKRLLDLPLSVAFCKKILGMELRIEDIEDVDVSLVKSFKYLQQLSGTIKVAGKYQFAELESQVDDLCLDFHLPGFPEYYLLNDEETSKSTPVTVHNLANYLGLSLKHLLDVGISKQVSALRQGISDFFPVECLSMFNPQELQGLISGGSNTEKWNHETILKNILCKHGYEASSLQVLNLAEVLSEFDQDDRRLFLKFVTGSPRLPVGGWPCLKPQLTVVRKVVDEPDQHLPSCSTCQVYLKLPAYSTKIILRQRITQAIRDGQGHFALD